MKWLFIQSAGVHKGQDGWTRNDYLKEAQAFNFATIKNGWTSTIWGKGYDNYDNDIDFDSYDAILCLENYDFDWVPTLSYGAKKIYWCVDLHYQTPEVYARICKNYDIILHSTNSLIPTLEKILPEKKHIWFPNCVDDRYFIEKEVEKTMDIAFVGSLPESRKEFIEQLQRDIGLKYFFATGEDMINTISSTKIHFNKNISCDINGRTFETIGLGTCLLTDYNPELLHLGFEDGVNCLIYKSYDDAIYKAKKYLANGKWKEIGHNGSLLAKKHTYTQRLKELSLRI